AQWQKCLWQFQSMLLVVGVCRSIWQSLFHNQFWCLFYPTKHQEQKATLHVQKIPVYLLSTECFQCLSVLDRALVCLCCRLQCYLSRLSKVGSPLFEHSRNLHCQIFCCIRSLQNSGTFFQSLEYVQLKTQLA